MLDNLYDVKEFELKAKIMENRLKRLEDEEARASKNKQKALDKALKLLNARNRHHMELLDKLNNYELRIQKNEMQRQKNKKD